ncbi:50S ribosomal protein L32 [Candidatus Dependentiae bacterium]
MPVPKSKVSKARRDKRSSTKFIRPATLAVCQTCQASILPHQVCRECGHYKGTKVIRTKADRMYQRTQSRQTKESTDGAVSKKQSETA